MELTAVIPIRCKAKDGAPGPTGPKGRDGVGYYSIDLDNEMACVGIAKSDVDGNYYNAANVAVSTRVNIFSADTEATISDIQCILVGATPATIGANISVSGSTVTITFSQQLREQGQTYDFRISAACNKTATRLEKVMTVMFMSQGTDGKDAVVYQLQPAHDSLKVGETLGTSCLVTRTAGDNYSVLNSLGNTLQMQYCLNGGEWKSYNYGTSVLLNASLTSLRWRLQWRADQYALGWTTIDEENVAVVSDGKNGADGVVFAASQDPIVWDVCKANTDTPGRPDGNKTVYFTAKAGDTEWNIEFDTDNQYDALGAVIDSSKKSYLDLGPDEVSDPGSGQTPDWKSSLSTNPQTWPLSTDIDSGQGLGLVFKPALVRNDQTIDNVYMYNGNTLVQKKVYIPASCGYFDVKLRAKHPTNSSIPAVHKILRVPFQVNMSLQIGGMFSDNHQFRTDYYEWKDGGTHGSYDTLHSQIQQEAGLIAQSVSTTTADGLRHEYAAMGLGNGRMIGMANSFELWKPFDYTANTPASIADVVGFNDDTRNYWGNTQGKRVFYWDGSKFVFKGEVRADSGTFGGQLSGATGDFSGQVTAGSGKIAGFDIKGNMLTAKTGWDTCGVDIGQENTAIRAAIGGVTWGSGRYSGIFKSAMNIGNGSYNQAILAMAYGATFNRAIVGTGQILTDGWVSGYKFSKFVTTAANTIYGKLPAFSNGYTNEGGLKISENNVWFVQAKHSNCKIMLPPLTEVRYMLDVAEGTSFCVPFTVNADLGTRDFEIWGRRTESANDEWPVITNWDDIYWDFVSMGAGDSIQFMLVFDSTRTDNKGDYSTQYTARVVNRQN